jgi:zinc/manganese transport system substrate-binding protein
VNPELANRERLARSASRAPSPGPSRARPRETRFRRPLSIAVAALVIGTGALVLVHEFNASSIPAGSPTTISVVAAESFWGNLAAQLGGSQVTVLSLVSDPNADPHEYEATVADAVAVANARLVIENGDGYDDWCAQLVAASGSPHQLVLNVGNLLGMPLGSNPHFWYGAAYVNTTIAQVFSDLVAVDPAATAYFEGRYAMLNASLYGVWATEAMIRGQFAGSEVASTESIFAYMAVSTGLNLVSPPEFMSAVSEGSDPPASSITTFEQQIESGSVRVMVYNEQTATPLTLQMQQLAAQYHVATVAVTETLQPLGSTFQAWMEAELATLLSGLQQPSVAP